MLLSRYVTRKIRQPFKDKTQDAASILLTCRDRWWETKNNKDLHHNSQINNPTTAGNTTRIIYRRKRQLLPNNLSPIHRNRTSRRRRRLDGNSSKCRHSRSSKCPTWE